MLWKSQDFKKTTKNYARRFLAVEDRENLNISIKF